MGNTARSSEGNTAGILLEVLWDRAEGNNLFNKALIGGDLVFKLGDGELTNQHPAWKMLWEML